MTKQRSKTPITIFDVAALAGVSRGTVDRVVYKRGRVSQKTIDKVQKAISQLGYTANPNASSLALKREYTFACLIPEFRPGEYWEKIFDGFRDGVKALSHYNIKLDFHLYDQTDTESYRRCSDEILRTRPMGVITNAVFKEEVVAFAQRLEEAGIPYAFVDNKIDDLDYLLYYGVDPYKSGALGAFLLTTRCEVQDIALIRLIRDRKHKADPNAPRRHGFLDYIEETFPQCRIHTLFIHPEQPDQAYATLERFFREHPEVKHLAMTNSRIFLIDDYLRRNPDPERIVVGFDDLDRNLASLSNGHIEYLVTYSVTIVPGIDGLRGMRHQGDQTAAPQQLRSYGHPASPQSRQLLRPGSLRRSSRHRRRERYGRHFAAASEIVEESARTYADTAQTNEGHPLAEADCS